MARLYFDCGASDDSLNSSTPRIIMFDSLRNSVITHHKTKHNGHRVLTRVHVQSGVNTILYDSDTHGKNILNIYLDHCGNLYLRKDYHDYKLLADKKLEIVNIRGSRNYMFFLILLFQLIVYIKDPSQIKYLEIISSLKLLKIYHICIQFFQRVSTIVQFQSPSFPIDVYYGFEKSPVANI